jgi:rSAM/selenodomain-associated transferase 1
MGAARRCLNLFAKQPLPGRVKTRLAREPGFDEARAAALCDALLRDSVERCRAVAAEFAVAFSPRGAVGFFSALAPDATLLLQPAGDLGERLRAGFDAAFGLGFDRVAAVGADAPHAPAAWIDEAFDALGRAAVAIGPARDGGYWLIGLERRAPQLFEGVHFGSHRVRTETEARAAQLGLDVATLPETFDVDVGADVERLRDHLASEPGGCVHTRAWFEGRTEV